MEALADSGVAASASSHRISSALSTLVSGSKPVVSYSVLRGVSENEVRGAGNRTADSSLRSLALGSISQRSTFIGAFCGPGSATSRLTPCAWTAPHARSAPASCDAFRAGFRGGERRRVGISAEAS